MLLNWLLIVTTLFPLSTCAPIEHEDAVTIMSMTDQKDMSGKAGDPPPKYFRR